MKKITQLLFLCVLTSTVSYSQTTEYFEDESIPSISLTHIEQTFNITSNIIGADPTDSYRITFSIGNGWDGTRPDNKLYLNIYRKNHIKKKKI